MNILFFGESCTGKSTLADYIKEELNMKVYTGKDYFKLSKNKDEAKKLFIDMLEDDNSNIIFVATEKEEVEFVPNNVKKVLFKADLDLKKERFAVRFRGNLPKPVEMMLEKKHGMFDDYENDLTIDGETLEDNAVLVKSIIS